MLTFLSSYKDHLTFYLQFNITKVISNMKLGAGVTRQYFTCQITIIRPFSKNPTFKALVQKIPVCKKKRDRTVNRICEKGALH